MPRENSKEEVDLAVEKVTTVKGDARFPRLREVMPYRLISPGNKYAYIRANSVPRFMRDGWTQVPLTEMFEIGDVAYMVMSKGDSRPRSGSYIPVVHVERASGAHL